MKKFIPFFVLLFTITAFADTPPPGSVKAKMYTGDGVTPITATSGSLNVNITGSTGGSSTVNQGTAGVSAWLASITSSALPANACQETGGHLSSIDSKLTSPLGVTGSFYQATQPVSGTLTCNAGTGTLLTDSSAHTQPVSGTVAVSNFPSTQAVTGTFFQTTQPVSISGLPPLATGSNTIGNVNVNGTVPVSGTFWQATQPVSGNLGRSWTLSSGTDSVTISGSVTATNSANGATAAAVPAQATQVGGVDGSGNLRAIKVSTAGVVSVDGSAVTQPVSGTITANAGTNLNTSALALESGGHLSSMDLKMPALGQALAAGSVPVVLTASQLSTLTPLSTITANAGSGTFTVDASGHTVPVSGTFWQTTQPVSLASLPALATGSNTIGNVNINGTVPVSGSITATNSANGATGSAVPSQATQVGGVDGSGNLRAIKTSATGVVSVDGSAVTQPVSGTFFQATQPVSASSLPLPAGAATAAKQPALGTAGSASADVLTVQGAASMTALKVDGSAVTQPVSASSLPLPTGAATSALQTTMNTTLGSPFQAGGSIGNTSFGISGTLPAYAATPTFNLGTLNGAATAANQASQITQETTTATNTTSILANQTNGTQVTGLVAGTANIGHIDGEGTAGSPSGGVVSVQGVASGTAIPISSSALTTIASNTPAVGQTNMAGSSPVVIASNQSAIPINNQDGSGNTIGSQSLNSNHYLNVSTVGDDQAATVTAGSALNADIFASQDVTPYAGVSVQITGVFTATASFQGSNDNFTTVSAVNCWLSTTANAAPVTTAAAAGTYWCPRVYKQFRTRLTAYTSGTATGTVQLMATAPESPFAKQSVIVSGTVTTVGTVSAMTSGNLGIPGIIADVASAAITTTTTTAAFTPTFGVGYKIQIPVTVVSGTAPTNITAVQESADSGTNWTTVYTFPTISATGFYESPALFFKGNRVRYVQTIAGTTPSFTRAINRLQMSAVAAAPVNNNATFATGAISAVTTLTAPANAIGFILQGLGTNTANFRYAIGATASSTNGIQLFPGQDTGEIHAGQNISICPESGTQTYSIQWISQ